MAIYDPRTVSPRTVSPRGVVLNSSRGDLQGGEGRKLIIWRNRIRLTGFMRVVRKIS